MSLRDPHRRRPSGGPDPHQPDAAASRCQPPPSRDRMTRVSILVPRGSALLNSIVRLFRIFSHANDNAAARGHAAAFDVHLVGVGGHVDLYGGMFAVRPDLELADVAATDVAIVPALAGDIAEGLKNNPAFVPWMKEQYHGGAEIAALCTGAFFILDAGLIGAERCSARWYVEAGFRREFAQINLMAERTATELQAICSSGGAYACLQAVLERAAGDAVAASCAALFAAGFNRECQSALTVSDAARQQVDEAVSHGRPPTSASTTVLTAASFAGMFEIRQPHRRRPAAVRALAKYLEMPASAAVDRPAFAAEAERGGGAAHSNSATFRGLLKQLPARRDRIAGARARRDASRRPAPEQSGYSHDQK
jgi:transcriptional regulator GlxA family with amidase domain